MTSLWRHRRASPSLACGFETRLMAKIGCRHLDRSAVLLQLPICTAASASFKWFSVTVFRPVLWMRLYSNDRAYLGLLNRLSFSLWIENGFNDDIGNSLAYSQIGCFCHEVGKISSGSLNLYDYIYARIFYYVGFFLSFQSTIALQVGKTGKWGLKVWGAVCKNLSDSD